MSDFIQKFWQLRLEDAKKALEENNFAAHVVQSGDEAKELVLGELLPALAPASMSWGGSMTFRSTGLYDALKPGAAPEGIEVLDTYDKSQGPDAVLERRRQALLVDLFFTGTNAVTENGMLVNLDMYGNRVAGLTFGPRRVIVLAGRNKLVHDVEEAIARVKSYAAPANAMKLGKKTPCVKTAECQYCKSPERICNTWTISEKSFPQGRVTVVLINQDMGL